jgi:iron complex transport system substrate-binding protein
MNKILKTTGSIFLLMMLPLSLAFGKAAPETTAAGKTAPGLERIISTAPANTEIIADLGFADKLIALDPYSVSVAGVPSGLPLIDFAAPDAEAIIGMAPDLIVASEINRTSAADDPFKLLRDVGINIVYIETPDTIADIYTEIMAIAEALGVQDRGEALVNDMKASLESVSASAKEAAQKAGRSAPFRVYFEVSPFPYPVTFGSGTYLNEMIELAGGVNIFAGQNGWFAPSAEAVINGNPDVILAMDYGERGILDELTGREGFNVIDAVKNKRVYLIDGNTASQAAPGIVAALKEMAAALWQ